MKTRYLTISPALYLVEQEILLNTQKVLQNDSINYIFYIDRSGSMYYTLPQLIKDLKLKVRELKPEDTVTIGWFSSEGQRNFIIKGYRITGAKDYDILDKLLDANSTTLGCTCFSEILHDTDQVLTDLSVFGSNFSFCFFTDGYPVISNYTKEIAQIHLALEKIKGRLTNALFVGYGDYYNKELLSSMAEKLDASLIHSSSIPMFSIAHSSFIEEARNSSPKMMVDIVFHTELIFGIKDKMLNVYLQNTDGKIAFQATKKKEKDHVYMLTTQFPSGAKEIHFTEASVRGSSTLEGMVKAAYAASFILTQKTKSDLALEILGLLGDKFLIDKLTNAFTNAEFGDAEALILEAAISPSKRLKNGWDNKYLPPVDAPCLLNNVLKPLMEDSKARFYPLHTAFEYKKVGRAEKVKEGYPELSLDTNFACPFTDFIWNASKLNLSLQACMKGTVKLLPKSITEGGEIEEPKAFGFADDYQVTVFRNYTLIKDAFLNITKLPVSVSSETLQDFVKLGVIEIPEGSGNNGEAIHLLHLDRLPIINRVIAQSKITAAGICKLAFREMEIKGQLKALKWLKGEEEEAALKPMTMGERQRLFLKENGIKAETGAFSPPTETVKTEDFYMAKSFEIKIKGLSSLPKVQAVMDKQTAGKKLTASENLVLAGLNLWGSSGITASASSVKIAWLDDKIVQLKKEQKEITHKIQEIKFSLILGKGWFSEFDTRENNSLTLDGNLFTISLAEEKVSL